MKTDSICEHAKRADFHSNRFFYGENWQIVFDRHAGIESVIVRDYRKREANV